MTSKDLKTELDYTTTISSPSVSVVHFMADWAPECATLQTVLDTLANQHPEVTFCRLQAEQLPELSMKHEIVAVPTVLLFRTGKAIGRVDGLNAAELTKQVKSHAAASPAVQTVLGSAKPKEDLDTRLKRLVKAHKCMLFMKGNPDEPKCGFSNQTVALLGSLNVEYGTFDILGDDEVRQGLKTFSNWPTFPQLYLDGELLGGLDILKEMAEGGELQTMLPTKQQLDDRLKKLVSRSPVMVFMKGDPDTPKCGFSRTLMGILQETGVEFDTFDILTDEDVRQGLKKFSNWPTYPQLYVKGELVGGLDIIKEIKESGDLVPTLKGEV